MAGPVNIRVAARFPFPALVVGNAPVKLTKVNGIWYVSLDVQDLTAHVPSVADLASEYVLVWDAAQATYFKVLLNATGFAGARLQRSVVASPIVVAPNDQIINFNINAGAPVCTVPSAATRNGAPLTFKDAGGHAAAHNLTISFTGGELCDGLAQVKVTQNFQELTLNPYNDGVNTGYYL